MNKIKIFISALLCISSTASIARIFESKIEIENRFASKVNGALIYTSKEDCYREAMELPYKYMFLLYPKGVNNFFMYKRSDTKTAIDRDVLKQTDICGWEINLSLYDNLSVLEYYKKQGEPFTISELKALFDAQVANYENVIWEKYDAKKHDPTIEVEAIDENDVINILPKNLTRTIYIEPPEDVRISINYNKSLQANIVVEEQRKTFDAYNKYVAALKKTSKTTTEETTEDSETSNSANYKLTEIQYGTPPKLKPTKSVILTMPIPLQPDTAFGYEYVSSDGKIRAKLHKNAILFIDTNFDKIVRNHMEFLHKKQSEVSLEHSKNSTIKF